MIKLVSLARSLLAACIYPFVIIIFAALIVLSGLLPQCRKIQDGVVALWAKISLALFGVRLKYSGLEKLPEGAYLGLFNHTSNFDILAIQSLIPRIRFGAKIELFKIPIFGHAMAAARALPIARSRRDEVLKVYEQAQLRFAKGECFILSPEGTRQIEEKLGPFKAGPFVFAIEGKVPLVPIALKGASKIQPKGVILPNSHQWHSTIEVIVGDPIATVEYNLDNRKDLQKKVLQAFLGLGLS